jgi:hypothetical protein
MQVADKGTGLAVESVKASFPKRCLSRKSASGSHPESAQSIFIKHPHLIITQAVGIIWIMCVVDIFSCFRIQPVKPSMCTHPNASLRSSKIAVARLVWLI